MYKKYNFLLLFLCLFLIVGSSCKTTQRVEKAQLTEKTQTNVLLISPLDISNKVFNKTLNKNEKHAYELDLRENQLTFLPDSIGSLHSLTFLDLRNNMLTSLPPSIRNLKNLEKLDIRLNKGLNIPDWLLELQKRGCTVYY